MSQAMCQVLCTPTSLKPHTTLRGRGGRLHFTDEEMEVQEREAACSEQLHQQVLALLRQAYGL